MCLNLPQKDCQIFEVSELLWLYMAQFKSLVLIYKTDE